MFNAVAGKGVVTVSYADATTVIHEGHDTTLIVNALGNTQWNGGKPKITIDSELIAADAERAGLGYWDLFADTLIHEYYHAYDMFTCVCGNPHKWRGQSRSDYEADTSDRAAEKAGALAACLPD